MQHCFVGDAALQTGVRPQSSEGSDALGGSGSSPAVNMTIIHPTFTAKGARPIAFAIAVFFWRASCASRALMPRRSMRATSLRQEEAGRGSQGTAPELPTRLSRTRALSEDAARRRV